MAIGSQATMELNDERAIANPEWYPGYVMQSDKYIAEFNAAGGTSSEFVPPTPTFDPISSDNAQRAIDLAATLFPWATELGLLDILNNEIQQGSTAEQAYATIQKTPQYQAQFAGMIDASGVRRFANERQYLDTINDYKDVLKEFGAYDPNQDKNIDYLGFIEQGIDPNELKQRFTTYRELEAGSQDLRDAMYVYSGLQVSVDDLYQAVVSPSFNQQLTSEYDRRVALSTFDYQTFITRATEVGLARAAESLRTMQQRGLVTGQVVSSLLQTDPNFARQVMDALFTGTTPGTPTLPLDQLLHSFDLAMLASAATESGLEMPTRERVEALRQAGVTRARAIQAYGGFARNQGVLQGASQRANLGFEFDQQKWEEAVLLGKGQAVGDLSRLVATEDNFGRPQGGFAMTMEGSRIAQAGRLGMQ